jgi:hypothetical protein
MTYKLRYLPTMTYNVRHLEEEEEDTCHMRRYLPTIT